MKYGETAVKSSVPYLLVTGAYHGWKESFETGPQVVQAVAGNPEQREKAQQELARKGIQRGAMLGVGMVASRVSTSKAPAGSSNAAGPAEPAVEVGSKPASKSGPAASDVEWLGGRAETPDAPASSAPVERVGGFRVLEPLHRPVDREVLQRPLARNLSD